MDPKRLSLGEWVAGSGALILIVSLFLPWYSVGDSDVNAWQSMAVDDVLIAFAAVCTLTAVTLDAFPRFAGSGIARLSLASFATALALVLTVFRLLSPAPDGDVSLAVGAWLGLVGAVACVVGVLRGMRDEGPERRSPEAERVAAAAALAGAELLSLQPEPKSEQTSGGAV